MKSIIRTFLALSFCLFLMSCSKEEENIHDLIQDCSKLSDATVLSEEEKSELGIFYNLYRYEGKLYSTFTCFFCNYIHIAIDCDDNFLCSIEDDCMEDFDKKAVYIFSYALE